MLHAPSVQAESAARVVLILVGRNRNGAAGRNSSLGLIESEAQALEGYEVHYQQFVSGHDDLSWRGTFADGLIALLGR